MAFFGIIVKANEPHTPEIPDGCLLTIHQVALKAGKPEETARLYVEVDETKYLLCTLTSGKVDQAHVECVLAIENEGKLVVEGHGEVHVTGSIEEETAMGDEFSDEELAEMEMRRRMMQEEDESDEEGEEAPNGKKAIGFEPEDEDEEEEEEQEEAPKAKPQQKGQTKGDQKGQQKGAEQGKQKGQQKGAEQKAPQKGPETKGDQKGQQKPQQAGQKRPQEGAANAAGSKKPKTEGGLKCEDCGKNFEKPAGLAQHKKDKHPK